MTHVRIGLPDSEEDMGDLKKIVIFVQNGIMHEIIVK